MRALIIIDMVRAYKKHATKTIINNQLRLIDAFRKANLPVIFAIPQPAKLKNEVMLMLWGDEFAGDEKRKKGEKLRDLIPELQTIKPSKTIRKEEYSAFYKTDLEEYLKKKDIDKLYLCGLYSGVCVHYTGVDAAMRGILPIVVNDASGTEKKQWHEENIKRFSQIAGKKITTKELIQDINIHIRPFRKEDAKAASAIMWANKEFNYDGEATREALRRYSTPENIIKKSKDRHYFVAEMDGRIVGIGGYQDNELKTFFVKPDMHGRGIGKALIENAMDKIREKRYKEMVVQSSEHAEKFYEKYGFRRTEKKKVPYAGAQLTIIFMRRTL